MPTFDKSNRRKMPKQLDQMEARANDLLQRAEQGHLETVSDHQLAAAVARDSIDLVRRTRGQGGNALRPTTWTQNDSQGSGFRTF